MADALPLWLTDRSRFEAGTGHCARARFHGYHDGPHGYGWQRRAQSIPLVTGTLVHQPLAAVLECLRVTDALPPDTLVYRAIVRAQAEYARLVVTRGLTNTLDPAELNHRVHEQTTLLEGLVWTWVRVVLPEFHKVYRVIEVEQEDVTVIGCTCGIGDRFGEAHEHAARDCAGIGWMTRGDCLAQHRGTGGYGYHETKTTGVASMNWEAEWPYRVQLVAGVLGAERRLGITVDEVWIHALIKGRFDSTWDPEQGKAAGPKFQNSPLVYGWHRPANEPLAPEEWQASYNYVKPDGSRGRLGKTYARTGIWELGTPAGCLSPSDYWTRWIHPTGLLGESYRLIGPIYRQAWKLDTFLRQLVAEERRWQDGLWKLHDVAASPDDRTILLDRHFPQNRGAACHSYYGDTCPFLPVCERKEGWEDPALLGYLMRRPHHQPELDQAVGRGLLPPDDGAADVGEE
jgi:hypothetical protein